MAGMSIMAGICASPYPSPCPIKKVMDFPYPYPVNAGIPCQNKDRFGQYPGGRFICHLYLYLKQTNLISILPSTIKSKV